MEAILVSIPFIAGQWSLPASCCARVSASARVSIPFIAGQWSLPAPSSGTSGRGAGLNPLHCGAVVASDLDAATDEAARASQSPSLRGSGRFDPAAGKEVRVSVSQSPSLRGSGRFRLYCDVVAAVAAMSQSPSLRGSGRFC